MTHEEFMRLALAEALRARDAGFRHGLFLAVADFNQDGHADIATAPGRGSVVRVFDGQTYRLLKAVRAYPPGVRG